MIRSQTMPRHEDVPPHEMAASLASDLIRTGGLSSESLVRDCLDRIAAREDHVRAWAHLDPDLAIEQAKKRDREPGVRGPLHGVPVGIKDIIDTVDMPTGYGSSIYRGHQPVRDATCVRLLVDAGAVIMGKTVTTEFATTLPAATRNPHDLDRTPGGSSSGSAAAVADRMVPLAIGSQTSGSVVRPASFCGVFGLKGTFGRMPLHDVMPLCPSLDTLGMLGRSARDIGMAFSVLAGGAASRRGGERACTIGFERTPYWSELDEGTGALLEDAVRKLGDDGFRTREAGRSGYLEEVTEAQITIFGYELAISLQDEFDQHRSELSDNLIGWIERGHATNYHDYTDALLRLRRRLQDPEHIFEGADLLVTPSVKGEAPELSTTGDSLFCRSWTALGFPVLSVPGLHGAQGLPLGVQLVGRPGDESLILSVADRLSDLLANHR